MRGGGKKWLEIGDDMAFWCCRIRADPGLSVAVAGTRKISIWAPIGLHMEWRVPPRVEGAGLDEYPVRYWHLPPFVQSLLELARLPPGAVHGADDNQSKIDPPWLSAPAAGHPYCENGPALSLSCA